MNRRIGVVGLFVGLVLMIGVWLILPSEEGSSGKKHSSNKNPIVKDGKLQASRLKAIPMGEVPDLSLRSLAARQERLQEMMPVDAVRPGVRPPGVFALDQEGIAAAVDSRKKDLEACYETALFHTPELSGTLTLVLKVEPEPEQVFGKIASVGTESELDATVFEGCVATVFEELKFDAKESTTVRYPVTFEPPHK